MADRRNQKDGRDSFNSYGKKNVNKPSSSRRKFQRDDTQKPLPSQIKQKSKRTEEYEFYEDEVAQRKEHLKQSKLQKKQNKKKDKMKKPTTPLKRKIRRIVSYCIILTVVLIVGVVLSLTVLFKTQSYQVSGNTKYDEAEIIQACGISKNENIFLANKASAERKLKDGFAYIEDVDVSFSIPDCITIDIVEAVPSYMIKQSDTQYLVISAKGRILDITDKRTAYPLPLFIGPKASSGDIGSYVDYGDDKVFDIINNIVTTFSDNGYTGITEIDATDTANISITYDDRIKVKLGLPEDISYKIRTAMTIINEKLDINGSKTTTGELDVSNCNTTKKSYFREQSLIDAEAQQESENKQESSEATDDGLISPQDILDPDQEDSTDSDNSEQQEATEKLDIEDWYVD